MNPVDEYLELRKEAFGMSSVRGVLPRNVGSQVAAAGMTLGLGAALGAAVPIADKIYGAVTRSRDFKGMMEVNPDLQEMEAQDSQFFNQAYNSLRKVNPTFGRDPIIAGSYMRKMMNNPEAAGLTLASTVKTPEAGGPSYQATKVPGIHADPTTTAQDFLGDVKAQQELYNRGFPSDQVPSAR